MQRRFTYLLIYSTLCIIFSTAFSTQAQDNQRYMALSLVNVNYRDNQLEQIQKASDIGMNAVIITVRWDVIYQLKATLANPWEQYDLQIQAARDKGMKICLRMCMYTWCNTKVIGGPEDNTVPSCDGLSNADRMVGYDVSGKNKRLQQQATGYNGCDLIDDCGHVLHYSFASKPFQERTQNFARIVTNRYKYLLDKNELLYMSVVTTPEQEFGFPYKTTKGSDGGFNALFDYSPTAIQGFRAFLKEKYKNDFKKLQLAWGNRGKDFSSFDVIEPTIPQGSFSFGVFIGNGKHTQDWYQYRHNLLKNYSMNFVKTVKGIDARIKIVNDYGSLLETRIGNYGFKDIGEGTDGIKVNDGPATDHRMVTDMCRTNMPDKWIMNEAEGPYATQDQFEECYTHGAKLMSAFNYNLDDGTQRKMLVEVVNKYVKGSKGIMKPIETCGSALYGVDDMLTNDGCNTSDRTNVANNCKLYKNWRSVFDGNGNRPVRMFLNEEYTTDIRYNQPATDYSTCGSIPNFKDTYNLDCQKLQTLPNAIESYRGGVESVDCQEITGWALDSKNVENILTVDIYVDDFKIGTTQANLGNRPDLVTTYKDSKAYFRSFRYVLPDSAWFKSSLRHKVSVRFGGTNKILEPSTETEKTLRCSGSGSGICGVKFRLGISPDSLANVFPTGAEYEVSVSSNLKWKVDKSANWLTVSADTGSFDKTFRLKIIASSEKDTRTGKVTITGEGVTKTIFITQKGVGEKCTDCGTNPIIIDPIKGPIASLSYRGLVEKANCCSVKGWAFNADNYDDILTVDFYLDKQKIGSTSANRGYRFDLVNTLGTERLFYKAFCFDIPASAWALYKDGKAKRLTVRYGNTITPLAESETFVLSCQEKQICQESDLCINQNDYDKEITIYPNPNNGKFKAEIYSIADQSSIFRFVNPNGQVLKTENIYLNQGLNQIDFDVSSFQNGVFLLSIEMENGRKLLWKVVKN
jgi:Viral BACON domain/Secretion system C-terminal sorting domain/Beta-galactosidase